MSPSLSPVLATESVAVSSGVIFLLQQGNMADSFLRNLKRGEFSSILMWRETHLEWTSYR